MVDRSQRLRDALPEVFDAVELKDPVAFKKVATNVWNSLRRGISDTKRAPEVLDDFPKEQCAQVWEFILRMYDGYPRFLRQVLDGAAVLVDSPSWIEGFLMTEDQGRLALWKLDLPKRATDPSPVDVLVKLINAGAQIDHLLGGGEDSDVFRDLASRASEDMSDHVAYFASAASTQRTQAPDLPTTTETVMAKVAPVDEGAATHRTTRSKAHLTESTATASKTQGTERSTPAADDVEDAIPTGARAHAGSNDTSNDPSSRHEEPRSLAEQWLQPERPTRNGEPSSPLRHNLTEGRPDSWNTATKADERAVHTTDLGKKDLWNTSPKGAEHGNQSPRSKATASTRLVRGGSSGRGNAMEERGSEKRAASLRSAPIAGSQSARLDASSKSRGGKAEFLSRNVEITARPRTESQELTQQPGPGGQVKRPAGGKEQPLVWDTQSPGSTEGQERMDDLQSALNTNDNQVTIIMNQQTQATEGLTTQKDIVDSLLDAAVESLDVASQCLKPMLMGYKGESNPAHVATERVLECKTRLQDLSANIVIIGPCQSGKTSLCHVLVGYPLLPFDVPTMIVTKWTHIVGLQAPTLTLSDTLFAHLDAWRRKIGFQENLPQSCEGDDIAEVLNLAHKIVYYGRQTGHLLDSDLSPLCQVENFLNVQLAFASLVDLSDDLTDVGTLSLYDLPSPDGMIFEQHDLKMVFRRTLQQADGVLVTIDVSKRDRIQVSRISELIEECVADRLFRREDTWIVANAIDKIEDFHCYEGVGAVCQRVKQEQYNNFKSVIMDANHVIPTAAHLNLLALYGKNKIKQGLGASNMNKLRYAPWFAQLCHYYYGVNWIRLMRTQGLTRWHDIVEEIALHGQVTSKLCTSVLQTAYLNMFPRSVISVMDNLKDIVDEFLQTLDTLQGDDQENGCRIDACELKQVFNTYFNDVKRKTSERTHLYLPKKEDCETFLNMLPEKTVGDVWPAKFEAGRGAWFEDYSTAPVEDFLMRASRELVRQWQLDFQPCPEDCTDLVKKSHVKWERSVDHYMKKMGASAASRKKILEATADLRITTPKGTLKTLGDEKLNALVKEQAEQVPYRKFKQFFHRTRKAYELSPYAMNQFLESLWDLWCREARILIKQLLLDVVRANFDDMVEAIERVNERHGMTQLKEGIDFDFGFADELRIILPKLAGFDVEDPEAVDDNELERCEELCAEVRRAVNRIVLTANFGNGLDRNTIDTSIQRA